MKSKIKQFFSEKKALAITLSAVMAAVLVALIVFPILFATGVLGGAGEDGPEVGVYYFDAEFDEYTLSLNSKNTFTIAVKGKTETGKYTLAGEKLTLDFDTADKDNLIANLSGNVITIQYDGAYMRMLKKVNYTVSFATNGGSAVSALTVVNGKLVKAPANPTRDNYDFVGWYADGEFKTVFDFAAPITADTTLYAKWEEKSSGPVAEASVTVTDSRIGWTTVSGVRSYQVEIIAPDGSVVHKHNTSANVYEFSFEELSAAVYTVKVTAYANTGSADNVVMEAIYKHHALGKVDGFKVENGMLIYNTVENAQKYYVTVVCGNANHNHTEFDNGSNRFFNLTNCDMTADGIKVTVKAVAEGFASSISDEFVYKKELAAVEGLRFDEATQSVFWNAVENAEAYMVSVTCGDASHSHVFFNNGTSNSVSLNGCAPLEGGIVVKVYPVTDGYASPEASEFKYEMTKLQAPAGVTVNGTLVSWPETKDAEKYEIKVNGNTYETETNSYDMAALLSYVEGAEYEIIVRALSSDNESAWSTPVKALYNRMSTLVYNKGEVVWAPVVGATGFEVQVNDGDVAAVPAGAASAAVVLDRAGVNTVKVRFVDGSVRSEWSVVTVYAHAITFDTQGGSQIFVQYKAVGDKIDYPTATKPGYTFLDWYTVPGGAASNGKLFDDELFTGSGAMVLYAGYKANEYEIVYDYGNGGVGTDLVGKVPYNGHYTLEVPVANDATTTFGGWFSAPYGMGVQYTDQYGNSLAPWTTLGGGKMYAFWVDNSLSFTQTKYNGKDVYMVSAGDRISLVTEVTIPEVYNGLPVAIIAGNAFANCTNLETINIPATIEQIAQPSPFTGCTALKNVNVYDVEGVSARFWSADGVLFDNGTAAVASPKLFFMPVAKTGVYNIPEGISEIPESAFAGSSLSKIVIPASVTKIGKEAFAGSANLASVVFNTASGEQPLTIGARAFLNCTALEKITLPARLSEVKLQKYSISDEGVELDNAESAFAGCTSLLSINVVAGNASYKSVDGILYSKDGKSLLCCPAAKTFEGGKLTVVAGTQAIAPGAFIDCEGVAEVDIPNTVNLIGECAFYGVESLEAVSFAGGSLADLTIGKYAFSECVALSSVGIKDSRLVTLSDNAFAGCTSLESFELPATVTSVGASAFSNCSKLASITINASSKALVFGENVFNNCTSLTRVELPANVSEMPGIFNGCTSLTEVVVDPNSEYFTAEDGVLFNKTKTELLFFPQGKTGEYTIPETVTKIANGVFRGNTSLETINIPNTIELIGDDAFRDSEIYYINFVGETFGESLTIGKSAFEGVYIRELELPKHTKIIGERAFAYAEAYNGVVLNDGVETLGSYAFYDADFYYEVNLPASVKTIGDYCFAAYDNYGVEVEQVVEDAQLEHIGSHAFSRNGEILNFTITKKVKTIGDYAFYNCDELGYSGYWSSGVFKIEEGGVLESIGNYAFYGCAFPDVTIPKTVNKIGAYAFAENGYLETVTFEEGGEADLVLGSAFTFTYLQNDVPITTTVRGHVFDHCEELTTVTLPERLVEIGEYSFYYAGSYLWSEYLTVSFGENSRLATIGDGAFYYANLQTITIPKSVRNLDPYVDSETGITYDRLGIGKEAFFGLYDSLTTVIFEAGGTGALTIGANAFDSCRLLEAVELPGRLAPYTSHTGEVIPGVSAEVFNETDGLKSITVVGDGEYYASNDGILYTADMKEIILCPAAKEGTVSIPATVTKIHDRAFYGCSAITAITFAGGTDDMSIGNEAFAQCDSISEITLPANVKTLGSSVFENCDNLATLNLPAALASFDGSVVNGCPNLSTINIGTGENSGFKVVGGVMFSADGTVLVYYPATLEATTYTVPEGVKYIKASAFSGNTKLESIVLPDGLLEIGSSAFMGCTYLERINIPGSVLLVGDQAFSGCRSLSSVTFADSDEALIIGNKAFYTNYSLESIALPARLAEMGEQVFYNAGLAQIEFAENIGLVAIGEMAFYGTELVNVVLPDSIVSIGSGAFYYCENLESVTFGEGLLTLGDNTFTGCSSLVEVHFPASLRAIGKYTFSDKYGDGCASLKTVTFAPGCRLEAIPEGTFAGTGIESIVIPASVKEIADKDITTSESIGAFAGCSSLATVIFEDNSSCAKIGNYAFYQCTSLDGFVIPSSVISIGDYAFAECSSLSGIVIPATTTQFGGNTFRSCSSLATAVLNTGATALSEYMFAYCYALETVVIPANVATIGVNCFDGCVSAFDVAQGNTHFVAVDGVLYTADKSAIVLYPANKTDSVLTIPKEITVIPEGLFSGNKYLREVIFEAGGTQPLVIEESAFYYCDNLYKVVLPERLTSIGEYAFYGCAQLYSINLPRDLKEIGYDAFYRCYKLVEVYNESSLPVTTDNYYDYGYVSAYALNVYTPTEGASILSVSGDFVLFDYEDDTYLLSYLGDDTVITIPSNVDGFYDSAFEGNKSLESIIIPAGVGEAYMGDDVFYGCDNLTILVGSETVSWSSGWNDGCPFILGWDGQEHTYTFETDGGTAVDSITTAYAITLPTVKKDGFVFMGWYDGADFTTANLVSGAYYSKTATTLYASWMSQADYDAMVGVSFERPIEISLDTPVTITIEAGENVYLMYNNTGYTEYGYISCDISGVGAEIYYGDSSDPEFNTSTINLSGGRTFYLYGGEYNYFVIYMNDEAATGTVTVTLTLY